METAGLAVTASGNSQEMVKCDVETAVDAHKAMPGHTLWPRPSKRGVSSSATLMASPRAP